jgi:hypothetical protein
MCDTKMEQFQHLLPAQTNSLNAKHRCRWQRRWSLSGCKCTGFLRYRRRMCSVLLSSDSSIHTCMYMYNHLNSGLFHRRQSCTNSNTTFLEMYRGADKSLARPGRKQATATKLWLLQATQTKFRKLSVQPDLRGSNDLCVGRKMATFQLLFQSGRAKDLSAPLYVCNLTKLRNHPQRPDRLWGTPRRRRVKLTAISILWWRQIKPKDKFLLHTLGVNYTPSGFISQKHVYYSPHI